MSQKRLPLAPQVGVELPATTLRRRWAGIALLIGVCLVAYWPAFHGGFIFDDNVFLTENPLIATAGGLQRFWFTHEPADYWPVTSTTLWLEWRLWGLHAAGYHVTNIALHVVEVLLLWDVLRKLRVPGAFVGALLFAVHPLNGESVAWITQRKNLMGMLFYLLAIRAFLGSESRAEPAGQATQPAPRFDVGYAASLVAFVLAMLSKGAVVFLPFVLWGVVCSRRRPTWRDGVRLTPFFVVAAALGWFESTYSTVDQPVSLQPAHLLERLLRGASVLWFYLGKAVWPANLSFDYGHWSWQASDAEPWLALVGAAGVTALLWHFRQRGALPALWAWGYFAVALLPVLGFAEVGFMRYSPVSNHYAHLALIGLAALAGAGFARVVSNRAPGRRWPAYGALALGIGCFVALTGQQAAVYADGDRLYRDTLARNPLSVPAHLNLGARLIDEGKLDSALVELATAVRLDPASAKAHNNLGLALYELGRNDDATREFRDAVRLDPYLSEAHNNLGAALARAGRLEDAMVEFEMSLRINPDYANAQRNLRRARTLLH